MKLLGRFITESDIPLEMERSIEGQFLNIGNSDVKDQQGLDPIPFLLKSRTIWSLNFEKSLLRTSNCIQ